MIALVMHLLPRKPRTKFYMTVGPEHGACQHQSGGIYEACVFGFVVRNGTRSWLRLFVLASKIELDNLAVDAQIGNTVMGSASTGKILGVLVAVLLRRGNEASPVLYVLYVTVSMFSFLATTKHKSTTFRSSMLSR
mmetsp:Transcript_17576/g.38412  ORF Transcript_17576/g.38412 Transcript_17576/m.38412 type:complete len:136 (-) Transcript_17576:723-1130(-)